MLGATNPLLRYVADAAPQRGELAVGGVAGVSAGEPSSGNVIYLL